MMTMMITMMVVVVPMVVVPMVLCLVPTAVIVSILKSLALASVLATMIPCHRVNQKIEVAMAMTTMVLVVRAKVVKEARAAVVKEARANAVIAFVNYLKTMMKTTGAISDPDVPPVTAAVSFIRRWSLVE